MRDPAAPPPLVCQGRDVDAHGRPVGEVCGRRFVGPEVVNDGQGGARVATVADQEQEARAAGWSVAGPPCCPRCRRPDPAITQGLTRPAPADRDNHEEETTL